jgi:demethylmenaquinone methyltransferase / 2-methoxy-6-polyprenyl-1,4-benzoquinol methylase
MSTRKPGLQKKWGHVVNSLQNIIPSYEKVSSRISLYQDRKMRKEAVSFAVDRGALVLDLGSGPGTLSRVVVDGGGRPVLLDASRAMLKASGFKDAVQGVFEMLPFRDGVFDAAVSGFAVRDAHDLPVAMSQLKRALKPGGRFALCDLGKPDDPMKALVVAFYLRTVPLIIGLASTGRAGFRYGSLYDTYPLLLHNSDLVRVLSGYVGPTAIHETQLGGSIVAKSVKATRG